MGVDDQIIMNRVYQIGVKLGQPRTDVASESEYYFEAGDMSRDPSLR